MQPKRYGHSQPLSSRISAWANARLEAGISIRELERLSGINRGRLSIIERGVSPTPLEADAINRALRVISSDGTPERIVPVATEPDAAA